jgi:hypothetical protein
MVVIKRGLKRQKKSQCGNDIPIRAYNTNAKIREMRINAAIFSLFRIAEARAGCAGPQTAAAMRG